VWVYDLTRKTFTRLTFGGSHRTPAWSSDGVYLYYVALAADGRSNSVKRKPADGSRDEDLLVTVNNNMFLRQVSADGRLLLIDSNSSNSTKSEIATLATQKDARSAPVFSTASDEYAGSWSPDGRWIAYQSDETSPPQVYVRDASGQGGRWQVSPQGGEEPHWSSDGRELYYRWDTKMMVVPVEPGATFQGAPARPLFDGLYNLRVESGISFSVDRKSGRFLTIRPADEVSPATSIRVALDWTSELRRLMQGGR
jgi:eukaryotic-like serine/threonine-protein kinase